MAPSRHKFQLFAFGVSSRSQTATNATTIDPPLQPPAGRHSSAETRDRESAVESKTGSFFDRNDESALAECRTGFLHRSLDRAGHDPLGDSNRGRKPAKAQWVRKGAARNLHGSLPGAGRSNPGSLNVHLSNQSDVIECAK
jgi:hypothetical protein